MAFLGTVRNKSKRKFAYLLLWIFFVGILLWLLYAWISVDRHLARLNSAVADNFTWNITQIEVDYLRLNENLLLPQLATDGQITASLETTRLRFDILLSRLSSFEGSLLADMLMTYDVSREPIADLGRLLESALPMFDGLDDALLAGIPSFRDSYQDLHPEIRQLSVQAVRAVEEDARRKRESLRDVMQTMANIVALMTILTIAYVIYVSLLNRTLGRRSLQLERVGKNLRAAFEASLDSVIVFDLDGRILGLNKAAERTFGLRREVVRGQDLTQTVLSIDEQERVRNALKEFKNHGSADLFGSGLITFKGRGAHGKDLTIEAALASASDTESRPFFVGFMRDVSERLKAEEEIHRALAMARLGDETKRRILTVVSHELRTPLNGLVGALELIHERLDERSDLETLTSTALDCARTATMIADNALDSAQLMNGEVSDLDLQALDLSVFMKELVSHHHELCKKYHARLLTSQSFDPHLNVICDGHLLSVVLRNLISNAIKFGGGTVYIRLQLLRSMGSDPKLEFVIEDRGSGLTLYEQSRIFNDFETLEEDFSRETRGVGLGLGIVRRGVELLGAELHLESVAGEGSIFTLRCPVQVQARQSSTSLTQHERLTLRQDSQILIAEDNIINRRIMCEMLETLGFKADEAENGLTAVNMAEKTRYDLIIMDVSMPVLDGVSATRKIRETGASRSSFVVAVTAYSQARERQKFIDSGMNSIIIKPVTLATLRSILGLPASDNQAVGPLEHEVTSNALEELQEVLGADRLTELLNTFSDEATSLVSSLKSDDENSEELAKKSHKVAGAAGMFGLFHLRDKLLEIECTLESGHPVTSDNAIGLGTVLEQSLASARRQIAAFS